MDEDVVVIGGGQAGLATSHELTQRGIEHVVLERGRVGQSWRGRWDSFCLVTPNWSVALPGHPYDGDDADGFMPRDEIVAYMERYASAVRAPVREGIDVRSLEAAPDGGFVLRTSQGEDIPAQTVVVATGSYRSAHRPAGAAALPPGLPQLDVEAYRNPSELPPGGVLIVGSGQSGCQIAEELVEAGREVFLACGRAPWLPRRIGDRDFFWWAREIGFLDHTIADLPSPTAILTSNPLTTGRDGGHDLHLRTLRAMGVTLLGRFLGAEDGRAIFADDLAQSVAWGDDRHREMMALVVKVATERGLPVPEAPDPPPFDGTSPPSIDLSGIGAVVFAGGFRPGYAEWIRIPDAFDEAGFPLHRDGACTVSPGLYFVGVHFLRRRRSSLLIGVGEDAALIADAVAGSVSGND